MKKHKFYCQPDIPNTVICWSFTGMIFLFSMLLWLEITVFQIWTLLTLILFLVVAFIEIRGRYFTIERDTITYHSLIVFNNRTIKRNDIQEVKSNRWGVIKIITPTETYEYVMLPLIIKHFQHELGIETRQSVKNYY